MSSINNNLYLPGQPRMTLIFVAITLILSRVQAWHNITRVEPGLIFESVGSIWKIVTYINMTTYFSELLYVESLVTGIEDQCNLLKRTNETETLCDTIAAELKDDIRELQENNKYFIPKRSNRSKRGHLNVVGHILKFLFGTMDNTDATLYRKHIDELEHSQKKDE